MSNAKILETKKTIVANIKEKFEKAQTVVLVDYRGLTVAEDTELRNQLRQAGVEYEVLKNTMINIATKDMGYEGLAAHLEGPTAVDRPREDPERFFQEDQEDDHQVRHLRRRFPG